MDITVTWSWGKQTLGARGRIIRDSALGQLQLAEQETISGHIIKALGSPHGLA